jgi:hypothetical protein
MYLPFMASVSSNCLPVWPAMSAHPLEFMPASGAEEDDEPTVEVQAYHVYAKVGLPVHTPSHAS